MKKTNELSEAFDVNQISIIENINEENFFGEPKKRREEQDDDAVLVGVVDSSPMKMVQNIKELGSELFFSRGRRGGGLLWTDS